MMRRRRFALTGDCDDFVPDYPNLSGRLEADGVDQLLQSDVACMRLRETCV
jgi:hypothetical protein